MEKKKRSMDWFKDGVFLIALNFLSCNIPGLMPQLSRLIGIVGFVLWATLFRTGKSISPVYRWTLALAIVFCAWLMLFDFTFLLGIGLEIAIIYEVRHRNGLKIPTNLSICFLSLLLYSLFWLLYRYSPYVWYGIQVFSLHYSPWVSGLFRNPMTLGPTGMGFWITGSMICYGIALTLWRKTPWLVIPSLLIPIMANGAYLGLQSPLINLTNMIDATWHPDPMDFQTLLLLGSVAAVLPINRLIHGKADIQMPSGTTLLRYPHWIPVILLTIAVAVLGFYREGTPRSGQILFVDRGTNWAVPYYGKAYGQHSVGMFGMMPNYLRMRGLSTRIVKSELTRQDLKHAAAVVVFNPNRYFTGPEKLRLYEFIEQGGGLLVAGDHTDVSGVMGPINDLLAPFPIRLNFDTALPIRSGWEYSLERRWHPTTLTMDTDYDAGIWVGASLGIAPPARPVIIGRRGWADIGNYANKKRAFLGDYKRSAKEQLSDIVLVAETDYGKGRVMVFGDTSTFQNGILPQMHPMLDIIIQWIRSGNGRWYFPGLQSVMAVGLIITALWWMVSRHRLSLPTLAACIVGIHLGMWLFTAGMYIQANKLTRIASTPFPNLHPYRPAYVDLAHLGRFSAFSSKDNSIWGFSMNLMRSGFIPMMYKEFSAQRLAHSKLFVSIAPTRKCSPLEIKVLRQFMETGGKVIWAVGWEEYEASRPFLDAFGISIDAVPLGPAEVPFGQWQVKFVEAWPVIIRDGQDRKVLVEKWDYPIMAYVPVGKGGLLVVGDSRFFHSHNIESYKGYKFNNIRFIRYLMDYLK